MKNRGLWRRAASLLMVLAVRAAAQTWIYEDSTSRPIPDASGSVPGQVVWTMAVPDWFTVSDLNVGVNISHATRGQVRVLLTAPGGTPVTLIQTASDADDNYDVQLDSASSNPLDDASNDTVASPFYDRTAAPSNSLNAFNGLRSGGLWTVTVQDITGGTTGTVNRVRLQFTGSQLPVVRVFEDTYWDGAWQGGVDPGVNGVTVRLFDQSGTSAAMTAAGNGLYVMPAGSPLTGSVFRYEVDAATLPAGYVPGIVSVMPGSNASPLVGTIPSVPTAAVNVAVQRPKVSCATGMDFDLFTTCFIGGPRDSRTPVNTFGGETEPFIPAEAPAVVAFPRAAAGPSPATQNRYLATIEQVGTTYGVAPQAAHHRLYVGAFAKRHADTGPAGNGAIYVVDTGGGGVVDTFIIPNAGTTAHAVDATNSANNGQIDGWLRDSLYYDIPGKEGLGDIDINDAGDTIWTVNLANRRLYSVNVQDPALPSYGTVTDLGEITTPAECAGGSQNWRPFALCWHGGQLYLGGTCTGEAGNSIADVSVLIFRLTDPLNSAAKTLIFNSRVSPADGGFIYGRGDATLAWAPWRTTWDIGAFRTRSGFATIYPQPWLVDFAFDNANQLVLGIRDRFGDQIGIYTRSPGRGTAGDSASDTNFYETVTQGDILIAELTAPVSVAASVPSNWRLETRSGFSKPRLDDPNDGVTTTEFFSRTSYTDIHPETAQGAVAFLPQIADEVAVVAQDPFALRSGGAQFFRTTDGTSPYQTGPAAGGYQIYRGQPVQGELGLFGKANGLGDLEYGCGTTTQQLGNLVWFDEDKDGVRDPREVAMAGVVVRLYGDLDGNGTMDDLDNNGQPDVLAQTTTGAGGTWYFPTQPATEYRVTFDLSGVAPFNDSLGSPVTVSRLAPTRFRSVLNGGNAGSDSDMTGLFAGRPSLAVTTGAIGVSTHNADAGFQECPPLVVGPSTLSPAVIGAAYSQILTATGGTGPWTWSVLSGSLPAGLSLSSGGVISGTPTGPAGGASFTVAVLDANGCPGSAAMNLGVDCPVITLAGNPAVLPEANIGSAYSAAITAAGGTGPYQFAMTAGSLPGGLNLGTDGSITGTPTGPVGTSTFTVSAIDANGCPGSAVFTIGTECGVLTVTPSVLPAGQVDEIYPTTTFSAAGASGAVTWALSGALPDGLTISSGGVLSGVPLEEGDHAFSVTATDANGCEGSASFLLTIAPAPAVAVGDRVFADLDGDGRFEPASGEYGVPGVTLMLYVDGDDPLSDAPVAVTETGPGGCYVFDRVPPGAWFVHIPGAEMSTGALTGMVPSPSAGTDPLVDDALDQNGTAASGGVRSPVLNLTPGTGPVAEDADGCYAGTLADADTTLTIDFGFVPMAVIGNFVWLDENSNGLQDAGERGIPHALVRLFDTGGDEVTRTFTDARGGYRFTVAPGAYRVRVEESVLPAGMVQTPLTNANGDFGNQSQAGGGYAVTVAPGAENLTADFGYNFNPTANVTGGSGNVSFGDRVWIDADCDGVQDPEEPGLPGVAVKLCTPGPDLTFHTPDDETIDTAFTDANGHYQFTGRPPGAWSLVLHSQPALAGYVQTGDPDHWGTAAGVNDHETTVPLVMAPGDVHLNADFGYCPPAARNNSAGDRVWMDLDADGQQDPGEPGIGGVTVSLAVDTNGDGLWDADGADNTPLTSDDERVIATDATDAFGFYRFDGVPDGRYVVVVNDTRSVLTGLAPTFDDDGTATPGSSRVDLDSAGTSAVPVTNLRQDFGYAPAGHAPARGAVGDVVWLDADRDGLFDSNENGIEGVRVILCDALGTTVLAAVLTDENGRYWFGGLDPALAYTVKIAAVNFTGGAVLAGMTGTFDADSGTIAPDNTSLVDLGTPGGDGLNDTDSTDNGINPGQDFGYAAPAGLVGSIGNLVWTDSNADGVSDPDGADDVLGTDDDEPGIGGVTIDVHRDLDEDCLVDPGDPVVASVRTAAGGAWLAAGLPAGSWVVRVTDADGVLLGHWKSSGAADVDGQSQAEPYCVALTGGGSVITADFGYHIEGAAVGNRVWVDQDWSGTQTAGDTGIGGVTVTLVITWPNGAGTTQMRALTDAAGHYFFGNLLLDEQHRRGSGPTSDPNAAPLPVDATQPVFRLSVATAQAPLTGLVPTTENSGGSDRADSDDVDGVVAAPVEGLTDVSAIDPAADEPAIAGYDFGFRGTKALTWTQFVAGSGLRGADALPVPDAGGNGGNPDGDLYTNLEEFAFCFDPRSGGNFQCPLELREGAVPGTVDACVRRLIGAGGVTYALEAISALEAAPGGWSDVTSIVPVVTANGDGTETACYRNIETVTGSGRGYVRVRVSLASPAATAWTQTAGFHDCRIRPGCETISFPLLNCELFSGIADARTGNVLSFTTGGGDVVFNASFGDGQYYVEIIGGPAAGHRFEVNEAASGVGTVALDLPSPLNTTADLSGLVGSPLAIREHHTVGRMFPAPFFQSGSTPGTADNILYHRNGAFGRIYLLNDPPVRWVDAADVSAADQGGRVIPPGEGLYIHRRGGLINCTYMGYVRSTPFCRTLPAGYSLTAGGYPMDESTAQRNWSASTGFTGDPDPATADQVLLWMADDEPGKECYRSLILLDGGPGFRYWTWTDDVTVNDEGATPLLRRARAALVRLRAGTAMCQPAPWNAAPTVP